MTSTTAPDYAAIAAQTLRRLADEATAADLPTHAALAESRREAVSALETLAIRGGEDIAGHAAGMAFTLGTSADACSPGLVSQWATELLAGE